MCDTYYITDLLPDLFITHYTSPMLHAVTQLDYINVRVEMFSLRL